MSVLFELSKKNKTKIISLYKWSSKLFVKISNASQILLRVQTMETSENLKKSMSVFTLKHANV